MERAPMGFALPVLLAVAGVGTTGCGLGLGSAYVGEWRRREEPRFEACLEDDAGRCASSKTIVDEVPAREFWGVILTYPSLGGAFVRNDAAEGRTTSHVRLAGTLEVLRGYGGLAAGVRGGGTLELGSGASYASVDVLGHLSLTRRVSLYGGGGYLPFARRSSGAGPAQTSALGGRFVLGTQVALTRTQSETFTVISLEADKGWIAFDRTYDSAGFTGHFGVFF